MNNLDYIKTKADLWNYLAVNFHLHYKNGYIHMQISS